MVDETEYILEGVTFSESELENIEPPISRSARLDICGSRHKTISQREKRRREERERGQKRERETTETGAGEQQKGGGRREEAEGGEGG